MHSGRLPGGRNTRLNPKEKWAKEKGKRVFQADRQRLEGMKPHNLSKESQNQGSTIANPENTQISRNIPQTATRFPGWEIQILPTLDGHHWFPTGSPFWSNLNAKPRQQWSD